MRIKKFYFFTIIVAVFFVFGFQSTISLDAQSEAEAASPVTGFSLSVKQIDDHIQNLMEKGKIPGASVVIIRGQETAIKGYGFADLESQAKVTPETMFELGSCSKSFTALAILQLAREGLLNVNDPLSKYFPGVKGHYKNKTYDITINHLLHHTSGFSGTSFGAIPISNDKDAFRKIIEIITDIDLIDIPGRGYEYSNLNFAVAGALIEEVSGMKYEDYMEKNIFRKLGMNDTFVGVSSGAERNGLQMATGYKISYGNPVAFDSPYFRGNASSGYVVTNGNDMAKWLKAQLALAETELMPAIETSHVVKAKLQGTPDTEPNYNNGWFVRPGVVQSFFHTGLNPNFTSYVALIPQQKIAVAIMANSNSAGSIYIGQLLNLAAQGRSIEEYVKKYEYQGGLDDIFTKGMYGLSVLLLIVIGILIYIIIDTVRGIRKFESFGLKKILSFIGALVATLPVLGGIYLIPGTLQGMPWETALAWAPDSFKICLMLLLAFLVGLNLLFLLSLLVPYKDKTSFKHKYIKPLPLLLFLSFTAGIAGSAAVVIISTSFFATQPLKYMLYYFGLALFISVMGQKIIQTKMINIANNIVFELRMKLVYKIFGTRFQKFEKIDSGRVYATLNNDTETIANSAGMVVGTVTSFITALAAFVYLSAISLTATLGTLGFSVLLGVFYIAVGKKARALMEKMRDTQNVFMKLIEGMVQGFREISMHFNKKIEYEKDVEKSCDEYRRTRVSALVKFVNANLFSSSMILILLATICFSFPRIFPDMSIPRMISFIMVLLYMIGPVTSIMSSIPQFIRIKVSWDRIQKFIAEIPAMQGVRDYKQVKTLSHKGEEIESIDAEGLTFKYPGEAGKEGFSVGPIDISAKKGEILFLVGGNGSGKTTLAMLLTGLYDPQNGKVKINGHEIGKEDYLGEYFSVVFGDFHIFQKLYNVKLDEKRDEIEEYLELLDLKGKVELKDGSFSTIDLSGGQKKRLALLQCYLENCPIYLFDEVAADQDPQFRKFFYRDLLMRMKEKGKIVIAITHDDHYFDVADKIIKLDMGKIDDKVLVPGSITGALPPAEATV
jgi:putative pyoverdin transport system ATP-binding/permease protein